MLDEFLEFSSEITAFTKFDLLGTGQAEAYLQAATDVVGPEVLRELLDAYAGVRTAEPAHRDRRMRREIFGDEKLGPIARNIVKLWYVSTWFELPQSWTQTFGAVENNVQFVVSPSAYTEGLLWVAIGANPPGAKAPGFASWVGPPQIPPVPVLR
jgi:hypothetical protein